MIAHLKLDDRLAVLRAEDRFRSWESLDDHRLCIVCKKKFNGRQVEIRRLRNGRYELRCPTDGCNSRPHLWVYQKDPLMTPVIGSKLWRSINGKRERRAFELALRTEGSQI